MITPNSDDASEQRSEYKENIHFVKTSLFISDLI